MLAENGIFTGEKLGDKYFFKPDTAVTPGEFLAMCPRPDDIEPLSGIIRTEFYDDDAIPIVGKTLYFNRAYVRSDHLT